MLNAFLQGSLNIRKSTQNMKRPFLLIPVLLLATYMSQAQSGKTLSTSDYQKAVNMLDDNLDKYIDNDIHPRWTSDGRVLYASKVNGAETYKLFNPDTKKFVTAATSAELYSKGSIPTEESKPYNRNEITSPDGKHVAFIKDWNLWTREISTGKEKALTTDGIKDFGYATDNAGWKHSDRPILSWSPDSKKISTFQQDQRHVKNMYLVKTTVGAPELQSWKYPLPGDEDIIRIHRVIIDVNATPKITRLKMAPDARRGTLCDDISCEGGFDDNVWSTDSKKLVFVSTSRDHKEANVRMANTETGEVNDIFEEKVDTQFESGQGAINWNYFSETNEIIWYSERSDWGHLYMYDATTGKLTNKITTGDYVVLKVIHTDTKNRTLYFMGAGKEGNNPYFEYLYRVDFNGKNLQLLTPATGNHSPRLSPDKKYFIDSYSQPDVPPVHEVRDMNGKLITELEKTNVSRLKATGWQPTTSFTVKSADNRWDLYGLMYTPTNLDKTKKYPVVIYIYPGPQGGSVGSWNFYAGRRDNQALAELGFVVIVLEGSCNPGRSKSFHDACYGDMAANTLPDQISGLKQLKQKHDYLDLDRVGIWGHSGGGFATAAAMFKYPDFFKVGIAESGNHENRNYEDDWGERYNGLEEVSEAGISNYEQQANQTFAKDLKGKLMLIHGGLDDNVPPYNTYLVVDELIKNNKDFDLIILPNARHGYGNDRNYIMRRRWDYFVQHLMSATPPKEFKIEN
ncbi:MAG: dipeptidyl-peptidase-4 [Spirosomataceae bacterium]